MRQPPRREAEAARRLARAALASLEASRQRIDDLNVYPVPDGDTGTNLSLTARAVVEALEVSSAGDRAAVAGELTRAALMGARGNSGVILSQIVRGAAEVLGAESPIDSALLARALRSASDAAYRAVRRPVEGTMLTLIRELAEEAETRAPAVTSLSELLVALVRRGEDALAGTPDLLPMLREAGVVDAGGAGLVEIARGLAAELTGEPLPAAPLLQSVGPDALHLEPSDYRYCTSFVVEGKQLEARALEHALEPLGDSLLVVGDATTLKVHVHTDDPGVALSIGTAAGTIDRVEISDLHRQSAAREERLLEVVPDPPGAAAASAVVAVVAGAGNRRLFTSLGAACVVDGGQTMNPSTAELVEAIEAAEAPEVLVLPNNANVIFAAEQAAGLARKPVRVVPSRSIQAGLAALVLFDAARPAGENALELEEALAAVATGEVTRASRDVALDGRSIQEGAYLALLEGAPVAGGESFDEVAGALLELLLGEPREVLTLLTGEDEPDLERLLALLAEQHPELSLDVHAGGQPHYPLLVAAE